MGKLPKIRGFYFITDAGLSVNGIVEDVRRALLVRETAIVQYREKRDIEKKIKVREALLIKAMCKSAGVPFIVNDDVELAHEVSADGVHIGQKDMEAAQAREILGASAIVGVSVGSAEEARAAAIADPDYLAASAVFLTGTKPDTGNAIGLEGVRTIRALTKLPLAAIGGLNEKNIPAVIEAGADLICAISASLADGAVSENIKRLSKYF